ncbi:MAG TPA: polysaccharide biosynthesis tyrosine autokinase [Holophagaceae bacterium]|nr:polysaccharide biosynthesis tyrosine autokinase [Holophagaceae bacterium]
MNKPFPQGVRSSRPNPTGYEERQMKDPGEPEEMGFAEWLGNVWEGRLFVLGGLAFFLAAGGFYVWRAAPVYQVQAMLQVQAKQAAPADPAFAKMEGLFSGSADTQSEIEILQSSLVLGRTVEALGLDLEAVPKVLPVVGAALARRNPEAPRIKVDAFDIPDYLHGKVFRLVALEGGAYRLESPKGAALGTGKVGEPLSVSYGGDTLKLTVHAIHADPGQKFLLDRKPEVEAMEALRANFDVVEKGALSNVVGLTLKSQDPALGTKVLDEIVSQYIRHKFERKNAAASQTLAILKEQLPQVKAKLDAAESKLNQFRAKSGSVDIPRQADTYLQQNANLSAQLSALQQKKQDLLRTYRPDADVVTTLDRQIAQLTGEAGRIESKVRALPGAQQEVVRLSRDVQVNTDLYTALLNNIQQLQIASVGDVGNVTVVDAAAADPEPIEPKKTKLLGLFGFFGLLVGVGLSIMRKALNRGIEDHRLIESKLGLPVLVTIPHSKRQEEHGQAVQRGEDGLHLLAALNPDDLATESLRSLRTVLHFSVKHAANNIIMVTGPSPAIGKSFVSGNLAAVLAQAGNRVLAVDADLRKGSLHRQFWSRDRSGGLSDVLARLADWQAAVHKTAVPGLDLMMSGSIPQNPSELLMMDSFEEFLAQASKAYDYVILDAPPVLAVTDAVIIASKVGSVLMVAKYGQHPMDELRACLKRIERHGIRVVGCVFNDVQPLGMLGSYSHYRYAYHYRYE